MNKARQKKMDRIIEQMNLLAALMDQYASSIHPSAWKEQLGPLAQEWVKLNKELNRI